MSGFDWTVKEIQRVMLAWATCSESIPYPAVNLVSIQGCRDGSRRNKSSIRDSQRSKNRFMYVRSQSFLLVNIYFELVNFASGHLWCGLFGFKDFGFREPLINISLLYSLDSKIMQNIFDRRTKHIFSFSY